MSELGTKCPTSHPIFGAYIRLNNRHVGCDVFCNFPSGLETVTQQSCLDYLCCKIDICILTRFYQ